MLRSGWLRPGSDRSRCSGSSCATAAPAKWVTAFASPRPFCRAGRVGPGAWMRCCQSSTDANAKDGLLPDVSLEKGVLKIAPLEKSTPPEAEALAARLYAMLPSIRITDLLSEVARWTLFTDCFTHLRSGETVADPRILMAGLLADGLNLGLTRMAEACTIASLGQPGSPIGIFVTKLMPSPCGASSIISSASRW